MIAANKETYADILSVYAPSLSMHSPLEILYLSAFLVCISGISYNLSNYLKYFWNLDVSGNAVGTALKQLLHKYEHEIMGINHQLNNDVGKRERRSWMRAYQDFALIL